MERGRQGEKAGGRRGEMLGVSNQRKFAGQMLAMGFDSLEELLCKPGVDAQWLLHEAARYNLVERMAELVDRHGAGVNAVSDCGGDVHEPPLLAAAEDGAVTAVDWLVEHGANVESRSIFLAAGGGGANYTALWAAAQHGNVRIAKLLLDAGADVDTAKNPTGNTALFMAVQNGHKAMVALLLRSGADPNKGKDVPPIVMAVGTSRLALVAQLVNAGARIPLETVSTLAMMRSTKKTVIGGYIRKVSEDELNALEELINVNSELKNNEAYGKARILERKGKYREALRFLGGAPPCAQLKLDIERLVEAIYGVKGSDGRVSVWNQIPISGRQPRGLQYYAWARQGRKIFQHGGVDFMRHEKVPSTDELWVFDTETTEWSLKDTTGKTPGPRAGHTMFAYEDDLFLWGGISSAGISDSKLYRLKIQSFTWEVVKTKGSLKPPAREEHAGVLYKGKYYMSGGNLASRNLTNDMWCLDMSNFKWNALKSGPTERHCHGMWAANGKIYVLGGRTVEKHIENPIIASHTIEDFVSYDIGTKKWTRVPVIGDRPHDISEYTVLPLHHGHEEEEPSSIIVWGGYTERDQTMGPPTERSEKAKYGTAWRDFIVPYRKRLLRFDIETQSWVLLEPTKDLLPKAQSFAAEMQSANGQTRLIFGGGYGHTLESKSGLEFEKDIDPLILEHVKKWRTSDPKHDKFPEPSKNIYDVIIADQRGKCVARDDLIGKSWAWHFFDLPGEKRPSVQVECSACSPTLHQAIDLSVEDFQTPACNSIRPNDPSTLGVRVKLHGLKGRKDLNGQVGRCGPWLEDRDRYQVFLPAYESGGPASLSTKPSNLLVAKPWDANATGKTIAEIGGCSIGQPTFPSVIVSLTVPKNKLSRPPLDYIVNENVDMGPEVNMAMDTYHGPVSAKAQVILRAIAEGNTAFKSSLLCLFLPTNKLKEPSPSGADPKMREEQLKKRALFVDFYSELKERDSDRVKNFEADLSSRGLVDLGPWLQVVVTMDGLRPLVRRELIVSPDISMQCLHHQVLCPVNGWTNNLHCYAFRRIHGCSYGCAVADGKKHFEGSAERAMRDSIVMMSDECWIGPKVSTALDSMFQPLYIGGALANDKRISLGDLFVPNELGEMHLQYVHDFGDWWSHSICVTKYEGQAPTNASVAHLVSGEGGCPPEDIGGSEKYARKMSQLTGKMPLEKEDGVEVGKGVSGLVDPTSERWWGLLNSEVRGKLNGTVLSSPLDFNLEASRAKLETAVRRPKQKVGRESDNITHSEAHTGLTSEIKALKIPEQKDPTKYCAVCGVTVALKTCSGCGLIAFCCREHQVEFWPKHKVECKRIQKMKKGKR